MKNIISNFNAARFFKAMPLGVIFALKAAGLLGRMTAGYRGRPAPRFMRMGLGIK